MTLARVGEIAGALCVAGVLVATLTLHWRAQHAQADWQAQAGAPLFDGREPLLARIDGHSEPMVPAAVACANCHRPQPAATRPPGRTVGMSGAWAAEPPGAAAQPAGGPVAADPTASVAPVLDAPGLTTDRERRGGPPSHFDRASFCRLLRTGEDPAGVLLPKVMPRYEIDDATCLRLWRHLTRGAA